MIDTDGDGEWNYIYDPAATEITPYEKEEAIQPPWLIVAIFLAVIAAIIIIAVLYKKEYF